MIDNAGNDTFIVSYAGDSITEAAVSTSSLVKSSITFTLGTNLNNLTLMGSGNISGTGNAAGGNVITGNTGNDVLSDNSGTAADTLIGNSSAGHDTFVVHNLSDLVSEAGTSNANLVQAYGTFSVASVSGINKLTLMGAGTGLTATGNNGGDTITDSTTGAGHNILVSGTGVDNLVDNSTNGNDTFIVNNAGDTITEAHGSGTVIFNASSVTYTLGTNITNVTLNGSGSESITGNAAGGDVIRASSNAGATTGIISDGAGGNDTMYAGSNSSDHDTFIINNAGDKVVGSNTGWAQDEIDFYLTGAAFNMTTNSTDVNYLVIEGTGTGHDTITANTGNDSIYANSHANTFIDGGTHDVVTGAVTSAGGADTFHGGGGFDAFTIHNSNDVIVELTQANT
jgi:Ca2+-binding RTX toxin-like protein